VDRGRAIAAVVSVALIGVTLEPLVRDPYDDGFPLSTYPMFATKRPTTMSLHYALGTTATGGRRTLAPYLVGTPEVLQAMRIVDRAVSRGRDEATRLCMAIAGRVAGDAELRDVVAIRIVYGSHDAIDYLVYDRIGVERDRVRCEVKR
jgi:hypothetical protein